MKPSRGNCMPWKRNLRRKKKVFFENGVISFALCLTNHRIIEWFGLEATLKIIWFQPPAMSGDIFHQTRLLRVPSNLDLNTAREGAATASPGNLCQCFNKFY